MIAKIAVPIEDWDSDALHDHHMREPRVEACCWTTATAAIGRWKALRTANSTEGGWESMSTPEKMKSRFVELN